MSQVKLLVKGCRQTWEETEVWMGQVGQLDK